MSVLLRGPLLYRCESSFPFGLTNTWESCVRGPAVGVEEHAKLA
jgi:hypothetical protein